ncbi:MAG: methyltransferase domain-containing protein [Candidatus Scalindua sp.]|nr:methyltransferase domain-containing protein [Candidatus Scalindua sp.]
MKDNFDIKFDFGCCANSSDLKAQLVLQPQDTDLMYRLANCLGNDKSYQESESLFLQVAQQAEEPILAFEAWFRAGISSMLDQRVVNALEFFHQAGVFNKNNHDLHIYQGICYYQLGIKWRANIHWWESMQLKETTTNRNLVNCYMTDDVHPERNVLFPLCQGKGIDVGCSHRKTHPDAIGVDITRSGAVGSVGSATGKLSKANIVTSGDQLDMFVDGELDYLVQRHNLEHYQDTVKTLQEWKRVVKPGGILGMVIPDDEFCNTIQLDPTHLHVFTQSSFKRLIGLIGGLEILHMDVLLKDWSFVCILQKMEGFQKGEFPIEYDYKSTMLKYEKEESLAMARKYEMVGDVVMVGECRLFAEKVERSLLVLIG